MTASSIRPIPVPSEIPSPEMWARMLALYEALPKIEQAMLALAASQVIDGDRRIRFRTLANIAPSTPSAG